MEIKHGKPPWHLASLQRVYSRVLPVWNTRNQPDGALIAAAGSLSRVTPATSYCVADGGLQRCVYLPLLEAFYAYERMSVVPTGWHGSLMEDKQDRTRTLYRRNRADDPNTGRFTQEDPGGLAGGLNLYGYAAGDPVNFSDPFGLDCRVVDTGEKCPKTKTNWGNVVKTLGKHALILGFALLTEGAGEFAEFAEASEALGAGETLEGGAAAASTAEGEAAATSEAVEGAETREVVKTRPNPGRDGGTSRHIIEKEADGTTRSVTHQVEKNGEILHQHQTHIGKYGSQRRFPDAWIKYPTVPQ